MSAEISLETACERILGIRVAQALITRRGIRWAVVAAMVAATNDMDADAIARLRKNLADIREAKDQP